MFGLACGLAAVGATATHAAIQSVGFAIPGFRPAEGAPIRAAQAEIRVLLDASPSRYRLDVFPAATPGVRVSTRNVEHPDPPGTPRIHPVVVPLVEGGNSFTVRAVDLNQPTFALSSAVSPVVTRDLLTTVSTVSLDRIEPFERVTQAATATLVFTIRGISESYAVEVERNGIIVSLNPGFARGEQRIPNVPLLEGDNFFRVRITSSDTFSTDPMETSNVLRIVRDSIAPTITNLIVANPPLPTGQAVVNIQGDTEPFAIVRIDDGQGTVVSKRADPLGNFSLNGVELPLVLPGPTTTVYQVNARDDGGNVAPTQALPATRIAVVPRFEFLRLSPFDGSVVAPDVAVHQFGLAGVGQAPYTVRFRARAGAALPALEETISVLGDATPFQKDTILVGDTTTPGVDVPWSFDAQVETTAATSEVHFLGTVLLDVADPPPVVPLDAAFDGVPRFAAGSFTLEAAAERFSRVRFTEFNGIRVRPSPLIDTVPTPIAPGAELRVVFDVSALGDGDFSVLSTVIATSGRTSAASQRNLLFQLDRTPPDVTELKVDEIDAQAGRNLFRREARLVRLTVRSIEAMAEPPEVYMTQQGHDAVRAVFDVARVPGFVFDYLVVTEIGTAFDGPVRITVVGGSDLAGNPMLPERNFEAAFVVDTRPPVIDSIRTSPRDGSLLTSAPAPIVVTLVEPADSASPSSGPDVSASTIRVLGPIETDPTRLNPGRVDAFDSQTLEFHPLAGAFAAEGTYQVEVEAADRAGNLTTHVLVYVLDRTPPERDFVVAFTPPDGTAVGATGLATDASGRQFVQVRFDVSDPGELSLANSRVSVRNFCPVPFDVAGTVSTVLPDSRRFTFTRNLRADGSDDGIYTIQARPADPAGNLQLPENASFVFDTRPPLVLDGNQLSLPGSPIPTDQLLFPPDRSIVRGPLRQASATIQDGVSGNGFTGSGIRVAPTTGTDLVLTLVGRHPTTTAPLGFSTATSPISTLRFEELGNPALSPCFLGIRRTRALLSLFTDPVLGDPAGLPADGTFDGEWEVRVSPVDRAGNRGPVNTTRFTYDTVPPVVTLDTILNDRVYTGPRLVLSGSARDNDKTATDRGQGIRRVQVRLEAVTPSPVTTLFPLIDFTDAVLTPDPALVDAEIPLPWRFDRRIPSYEGPARLILRVEDMAGNESFLVRELVLDIDPLPAPRLLLPPNRAALPAAVVRFDWEHVDGASRYELRIRDENANEIVRTTDFPFRFVDVNLGAFPAGRYTWTVRALDARGAPGEPAFMRQFEVDQEMPRVVRLEPFDATTPDARGGSILGGQVRIAIEFSEDMDTTRPPVVLFDPANPLAPARTVRQLEYQGRLWRGAVDIPATVDEPDVNGLATIVVREAFDRAGNPIAETRRELEVDIGPFWEVRAFANPILKREIIFYFRARESDRGPLESVVGLPDITIQQEGAINPRFLHLQRLGRSVFYGAYEVDATRSGNATIRIQGTDERGNTSRRALGFSVAALLRADQNFLRVASGPLKVRIPAGAVTQDTVVAMFPLRMDPDDLGPGPAGEGETSGTGPSPSPSPGPGPGPGEGGLELVRRLDRPIPGRIPLSRDAEIEIPLAGYGLAAPGSEKGLGLFVKDGKGFRYLPGRTEGGVLRARSPELSTFFLMRDPVPPRFEPHTLESAEPGKLLSVLLHEAGSGLAPDGIAVKLGSRHLPARYQRDEGRLYVEVPRDARPGEVLEFTARDRVDNLGTLSLPLNTASGISVLEAVAYPNPARDRAVIRFRLASTAIRSRVQIFDAAGRRVRILDGPAAGGGNDLPWDLTDSRGRKVANGVYPIELEIQGIGGGRERRRLKLAVLR